MKTLMIMRHAKSSKKNTRLADKERPINRRGEKDAEKMAELLEEKELLPQVILTSTALRARQTADIILAHCAGEITFRALDWLYMAEPAGINAVLRTIDEQAERVLLIGHNPGLEGLLESFVHQEEGLPTAGIACLELPIELWSELTLEAPVKKWEKWRPKDA